MSKFFRKFAQKFAHLIYETSKTQLNSRETTKAAMVKEFTTSATIVALAQKSLKIKHYGKDTAIC